jgi:general secretion pathway protein B
MSYILDALRKSDQQRRLGGVPTLTSASFAAVVPERSVMLSHGLPGMALIIAVGAAIAWLRPVPPVPLVTPEHVIVMAPVAAKPLALPVRQAAIAPLPAAPAKVEPEPARHEPPVAASPIPALAAPAPGQKLSASAATGTHTKSPSASSDMPSSIRKTLPVMAVAVHAYSNTPGDRLVSINGRMLRDGDTLAPDLRLEQITPDGMIFTYRGYRFRRGAQ